MNSSIEYSPTEFAEWLYKRRFFIASAAAKAHGEKNFVLFNNLLVSTVAAEETYFVFCKEFNLTPKKF